MQYCMCQPGSFMHLKMPNNRTGNDTEHLIISEPIQTPVRKNKEQQVRHKAWRDFWKCWGSKEQAEKRRTGDTKLYPCSSDLGSGWTHVATEANLGSLSLQECLPQPPPGQDSSVPEQSHITRAWGQSPPLPPAGPSCQRLAVKPIPRFFPAE